MVQALLNGITNFFLFVIQIVGGIIFLPISALLAVLFPDGSTYMYILYNYLDTMVFPTIKFVIQAFIQASHMPPAIFYMLVNISLLRWAILPALRAILLVYNVYRTVKGNKGTNGGN